MKNISLVEISFSDEDLGKCFREAADWIDKNKIKEYDIRGAMIEQDSEYPDWYISLLLYKEPDDIK